MHVLEKTCSNWIENRSKGKICSLVYCEIKKFFKFYPKAEFFSESVDVENFHLYV